MPTQIGLGRFCGGSNRLNGPDFQVDHILHSQWKGEAFMAGKALTKSEIASAIADKVGISKKQVSQFFVAQAELAYKHAKNSFVIPGIGKLVIVERAARKMIMPFGPDKGKEKLVPKKKALKFRVAKAAKDAVGVGKK
jgi:DNA-binding protein HU-beta